MKLLSANYTNGAINAGLLVLRLGMGVLLVPHGYDKIANFEMYQSQFLNFLGLGATVSLWLCIFAEFFCALLVIFGLFTRFACIPIIINFLVAVFMAHGGDIIFMMKEGKPMGTAEHPAMYAVAFLAILIMGPGRYSADAAFRK